MRNFLFNQKLFPKNCFALKALNDAKKSKSKRSTSLIKSNICLYYLLFFIY